MLTMSRPPAATPADQVVDLNDDLYTLVTGAVAQSLDGLEPVIQQKLEDLVDQVLQLNDQLYLEWALHIQRLNPQEVHYHADKFQAYRRSVWRRSTPRKPLQEAS